MAFEVKELRSGERYVFDAPLTASFGSAEVIIVNIADGGLQVLHPMPLRVGGGSRTTFRFGDVFAATNGRVIWSHLSKTPDAGGRLLYRSGIRVEDPEFAAAVRLLIARGFVRPDSDSLERKRKRLIEKERARSGPQLKVVPTESMISGEQLLLIKHARERLRQNPGEAERLFEQARSADAAPGVSNDVLAVWEYLERSVGLPTITRVFQERA